MEEPENTSTQTASKDLVGLQKIMLHLWDRLKNLASQDEPSEAEINAAVEEFSITWQSTARPDRSALSDLTSPNCLPGEFARLLYRRLRLEYLEYSQKSKEL